MYYNYKCKPEEEQQLWKQDSRTFCTLFYKHQCQTLIVSVTGGSRGGGGGGWTVQRNYCTDVDFHIIRSCDVQWNVVVINVTI